jgi:hypothetical protein
MLMIMIVASPVAVSGKVSSDSSTPCSTFELERLGHVAEKILI